MNGQNHFGILYPNGNEYCQALILEFLGLQKVDYQLKEVLFEPSEQLFHSNLE